MAKKNGSTPFTPEQMEQLEAFYRLPIEEQTARLAHVPKLAAENVLQHERYSKPARMPERQPELTRLHRLTDAEADLIHAFRLLSQEAQQAIGDLLELQAYPNASGAGNVVPLRR